MTLPTAPPPGAGPFGPPPSPGPASGDDPTAVMGRRILAAVVDTLLYLGLLTALFAALAVGYDKDDISDPGVRDDPCAYLEQNDEDTPCVELGERVVWLDDDADSVIILAASLAWFALVYVLLQGLTGATPGKAVTGLRVVDRQGQIAGVGPSTVRSLLWVVDAAPWVIPGLVGLVTGATTDGHRRVGDMAASTHVVDRASVGSPVDAPGYPAPLATPPPAPRPGWEVPDRPPAPSWTSPAPTPSAPPAGDSPWASVDAPSASASAGAETGAATGLPAAQWDVGRNTYLQWLPTEGRWLQWDPVAQTWKELDS